MGKKLPGEGDFGTEFDKAARPERISTIFRLNIIQALTSYAEDLEKMVLEYKRNLELGHIDVRSLVSHYMGIPYTRAFWPMSSTDENDDVYDLSAQGRLLDNTNVTFGGFGTGRWVAAGNYNGSNRYLQRLNEAGLNLGSGLSTGFSVVAWVKPDWGSSETGQAPVLAKGDGSVADEYHLTVDRSSMRPTLTANGESYTGTAAQALTLSSWAFVGAGWTYGSGEIWTYVNGVRETDGSHFLLPPLGTTDPLYVGRYDASGGAEYWQGLIGPVGLYLAKLDDEVVDNLFEGTRHLFGV